MTQQLPVVPKGYIARSVKPSKSQVTLPQANGIQPSFATVEALERKIAQLRQDNRALESSNYALAALLERRTQSSRQ